MTLVTWVGEGKSLHGEEGRNAGDLGEKTENTRELPLFVTETTLPRDE